MNRKLGLVLTLVSFLMILVLAAALGQAGRILKFKRRGGSVVAVIGATPKNGFYFGVALLAMVYLARIALVGAPDVDKLIPINLYIYYLCLGAMAFLGFLGGIDRLKVRENGLSNASLMVTWHQINDFHWDGYSLTLDHHYLWFKSWKTRLRLKKDQFEILQPFLSRIKS